MTHTTKFGPSGPYLPDLDFGEHTSAYAEAYAEASRPDGYTGAHRAPAAPATSTARFAAEVLGAALAVAAMIVIVGYAFSVTVIAP